LMLWNFSRFDFGKSYFRDVSVIQLIKEKLPVSMSLGIWMTLLTYLISIPLGIRKAVKDGSRFDTWTSAVIIIGYAIPGFLFAILLIILFAGGSFFNIFPLRGLTSDGWAQFPWYWKIIDYFWHITLPLIAMALGAFDTMTLLTKNSFLDEIRKQYVMTARAKGCSERQVLYNHIFRNAMLIVIAGLRSAFIPAFFSASLFIETIFSLAGLGLLGYDRPCMVKYDGHLYWPAFVSYSETTFGGDFETAADYRDPYLQKQIAAKGGTVIWPLIRFSYDTHNLDLPTPAPSKPTWMLTEAQCKEVVQKKGL